MTFINALLSLLLFTGIFTGNVNQPVDKPETALTPPTGQFTLQQTTDLIHQINSGISPT